VRALLASTGLAERVNALLIPGMIPEDDDRPLRLAEKLDVLGVTGASPAAFATKIAAAARVTGASGQN